MRDGVHMQTQSKAATLYTRNTTKAELNLPSPQALCRSNGGMAGSSIAAM